MDANKYLVDFYAQNGKKLRKMVDKILAKFAWITDKDHFYSLANEVFVDVLNRYDEDQDFNGFLYSCLSNKIKTEITKQNRFKRKADKNTISIDALIDDDENTTIGDMLASDYCLEDEVFKEEDINDSKIEKYLNKLSKIQRKIVELLAADYKPAEIKELLHITEKEYSEHLMFIHSYENISVLL